MSKERDMEVDPPFPSLDDIEPSLDDILLFPETGNLVTLLESLNDLRERAVNETQAVIRNFTKI